MAGIGDEVVEGVLVEVVEGVLVEVVEGLLVEVVEGVLVEVMGETEGAEILEVLTAVWIKSGNGKRSGMMIHPYWLHPNLMKIRLLSVKH